MSVESPIPQEEQQRDPVQEARRSFNKELFGGEYNGGRLTLRNLQLQNALLGTGGNLADEKIYNELKIATSQSIERAELQNDAATISILQELQRTLELNHENSTRAKPQVDRLIKIEGVPLHLECPSCNHEWSYKGRRMYASCPCCKRNVRTGYGPMHQDKN